MGPALLLAHETDHAHRAAAIKADWARSRPAPRDEERVPSPGRGLASLRRRTARLLHA